MMKIKQLIDSILKAKHQEISRIENLSSILNKNANINDAEMADSAYTRLLKSPEDSIRHAYSYEELVMNELVDRFIVQNLSTEKDK